MVLSASTVGKKFPSLRAKYKRHLQYYAVSNKAKLRKAQFSTVIGNENNIAILSD
jgi:hypothetical protein